MDMQDRLESSVEGVKEKKAVSTQGLALTAAGVLAGAAVGGAVLPFGAVPFGFGMLCAADRRTTAVYLGLCLSLLRSSQPLTLFVAYSLCLLLRVAVSLGSRREDGKGATVGALGERIFFEHLSLRVVTAALGAFGVGLYRLLISGFLYYDLFGALISLALAAVSTLLWYALPRTWKDDGKNRGGELLRAVSVISLCAAAAWGLRGIGFYGVSLSAFVCMLMTLLLTKRKGVIYGAFTALVAGLCVSVSYAPLFVFGAVCYGFLCGVSPLLACFSSFAVGLAWGIYIDGIQAVSALLPALLAANFLYFVADKLFSSEDGQTEASVMSQAVGASAVSVGAEWVAVARLDDAARRIKMLCEGFSTLSQTLLQTDSIAKSETDVTELISSAYAYAHGLSAEIGEIGGREHTGSDVPWYYGDLMSDALRTESLAHDFRAISEYLSGVMVENQREYAPDAELGERVLAELERRFEGEKLGVCVFGDSKKRIMVTADSPRALTHNISEICHAVSRVCGMPVRTSEVCEFEGYWYVTLTQGAVLDAVFAGRKRNSVGETDFCGDSFGVIGEADEGKVVGFISDGMGSGHDAAVTSGLCALFLQKLLPVNMSAVDSVGTTLEVLNGFLCTRNGTGRAECSATIDLGMFDLVNCRASFYKSGAAPTYVFRDGALFKLRSRTVPIGIVKEPDIGRISMELLPGDVIVMVSDGVTEGREECPELFEYLRSRLLTHNADQLADAIIKYADERGCTDDVSALVVKVTEKPLWSTEAAEDAGDAKDACHFSFAKEK